MGYYNYLKKMLEPVEVYDLENGAGAQELFVLGTELDGVFDTLEEIRRELSPLTAQSYGIQKLLAILPYRPEFDTLENSARALMALLRIRQGCFTTEMLQDTLSGCGIRATVSEDAVPMTLLVRFPENRGIPEGFEKLKERIESILPCHLAVNYRFIYASWGELMAGLKTWAQVQQENDCWKAAEIYQNLK